ncbi:MAG: caspase family protein [Pseudomonadota bacterium]
MPLRTLVHSLCFVAFFNIGSATAAARTHAVLVGISEYPNLEERLQLNGPRNDVAAFHEFLRERNVPAADIRVLADGSEIKGAGLPTRKAILDALAETASKSAEGDTVFLLLSGHGSQQPAAANDKDELDQLDEIFLPRDVGKWSGETGVVLQAITDNEIGAAITRIRNRGAFVWAIFDHCNSGTMTRSLPAPGERDRQVQLADLVDKKDKPAFDAAMQSAFARGEQSRGGGSQEATILDNATTATSKGGMVAFYAAQSGETTPEGALPVYSSGSKPRGWFSYYLDKAMRERPEATYRQIIDQVMLSYRAENRNAPTPMLEGTAQDAPIFGSQIVRGPQQWLIAKRGELLRLSAGVFNEVTEDSILSVVPKASSKDSELLGYVRVVEAGAASAIVEPVEHAGKPVFDIAKLSKGGAYARPVELKVDYALRVSAPVQNDYCSAAPARIDALVQELKNRPSLAPRVRWVEVKNAADVRLCVVRDRVLFLDGSGTIDLRPGAEAPGITIAADNKPASADEPSPAAIQLGESLQRIARVKNIAKVAGEVSASAPKIKIDVKLKRNCNAAGAEPDCTDDLLPITATDRPILRDKDIITVTVSNPTAQGIDLTTLYVDDSFGINVIFPINGESAKLPAGGSKVFSPPLTINTRTTGREQLLFIAVPSESLTAETTFVGLAQEGMQMLASRGTSKGVSADHRGAGGLEALFNDAASGSNAGTVRAVNDRTSPTSAQFSSFSWVVTK